MTGRKRIHTAARWTAVGLLALAAVPAMAQPAPQIVGSLSNFDVTNVDERRYNDFELFLVGELDPDCIGGWYPGWGTRPSIQRGTPFGDGVSVIWKDPRDPIGPGRTEHFGLRLRCDGDFTVRGFWSIDGKPVREVPLPWQFWEPRPGTVWDIIRFSDEFDGDEVFVQRQYTTLPREIPLENLNWDEVEQIVRRLDRDWIKVDRRPLPIRPGGKAVLEVEATPDDATALVRYVVASRGEIVARFINEAILVWPGGPTCPPNLPDPQLTVTGSEDYVAGGLPFTRYDLEVTNRASYPDQLFAAAPDLPPCGLNANSSRTWVDIHDGDGARLYGFCALDEADDLDDIWFARPRGTPPPECVSVTLEDRRCEESYQSNCAPTAGHGPDCVELESLALGTTYHVGDVFVDSGATFTVENFQWTNGTWTAGGSATVGNSGQAGASGNEISVNNVNLDLDLPVAASVVFLHFGEYGGNLNIEINGVFQNFQNFANIDGATIGGVSVEVTNGFGNDQGTLKLSGEILSLSLGGQELVIDRICVTEHPGVDASGVWVMPYAVGGIRLDRIQTDGLVDYGSIDDAPFGGRLPLQTRRASVVPTPTVYYYSFDYRAGASGGWQDFDEGVSVNYVVEHPVNPPFYAPLSLGPTMINGRNLYRFRPHQAELASLVPLAAGESAKWPNTGDLYRAFLSTAGKNLAPGSYQIRMQVYDQTGNLVLPGAGTFRFVVPTGVAPGGMVTTDFADPSAIIGGGVVFGLEIDNRPTQGVIHEPTIGPDSAGLCGFLRYNPLDPPLAPPVQIAFSALHPASHAFFNFRIQRGPGPGPLITRINGAEVDAPVAGIPGVYGVAYTGDGFGNFTRPFSRGELLESCIEGAFAEVLNVSAKATNGVRRLHELDSDPVRAFALTPQ